MVGLRCGNAAVGWSEKGPRGDGKMGAREAAGPVRREASRKSMRYSFPYLSDVLLQRGDSDDFPLIDVATIVLEIKSYGID